MVEMTKAAFMATLCMNCIITMLVTRLWVWAKEKRDKGKYHGAVVLNKESNGELKEAVAMTFYVSPLDYKQGDVMRFVVLENYVSEVEEGKEEKDVDERHEVRNGG